MVSANEQLQCAADARREAMEEPSDEPECQVCDGSGKLPPISQEKLTRLLTEYPDASEAGINKLLSVHACPSCGGDKCLECEGRGQVVVGDADGFGLSTNHYEPCPSCVEQPPTKGEEGD